MKAVIYARVSSEKQAEKGTSIPAQISICKDYLKRHNYSLYKIYVDVAKSALSTDRPAFQEMIEETKKNAPPFNLIVVYSYSRFARNRLDSITYKYLLRKKGIKVVSVTEPVEEDTPEGKLLEGIIEVINEFYSSNLARETFRGQKQNAKEGFWNGGIPPIGYRIEEIKYGDGTKKILQIDEKYKDMVIEIFDLFIRGYGLKKISDIMNQKGYITNKGNKFSPSTIRGILKNEIYTGKLIWNKYDKKTKGKKYKDKNEWVIIEDKVPKIIDEDKFELVQKIFEDRKNNPTKGLSRTHVLSGLIKCSKCGSNYIYVKKTKTRGDKRYINGYYICSKRDKLLKKECSNVY